MRIDAHHIKRPPVIDLQYRQDHRSLSVLYDGRFRSFDCLEPVHIA